MKNLRKNEHFTVSRAPPQATLNKVNGGQNKLLVLLTDDAFELVKNTYNLRNKYVPSVGSMQQVRVLMSLENQSIGFIASAFEGIFTVKRQMRIKTYLVDMCIVEHRIVVECDENGHDDRNEAYESTREDTILANGYRLVRFNSNGTAFDLSFVMRAMMKLIFKKDTTSLVYL